MKNLFILLALLGLGLSSCNNADDKNDASQTRAEINSESVVLINMDIEGMTCTNCENTIKSGVSEMPGVIMVEASFQDGKTYVEVDTSLSSVDEISKEINSRGYEVVASTISKEEMDSQRIEAPH